MLSGTVFFCDVPGCRSRCALSYISDLENPDYALTQRGWVVAPAPIDFRNSQGCKHACPAHADVFKEAIRVAGEKDGK